MIDPEQIYRFVLRVYPPDFRAQYERELVLVFRDQRRDGRARRSSYWLSLCADVARSAPGLWREELRGGVTKNLSTTEITVKAMALVAILVGAFEVWNSFVEARVGFAGRDSLSQFLIALAIASTVALVIAGIRLLMRGQNAARLAQVAALGCLSAFALLVALRPMMSIFATLLGIAFPIALLVYLFMAGRRGGSHAIAS